MNDKVYVALLDNGSGEAIIRGMHATYDGALAQLQKLFLEGMEDEDEDDATALPSLEEMNETFAGTGAQIIGVTLGQELNVELRSDW